MSGGLMLRATRCCSRSFVGGVMGDVVTEYRVFRHWSDAAQDYVRLYRTLNRLSRKGWRLKQTIGDDHVLMVRTVPKCWLDSLYQAGLSTRGANALEDHFGFLTGVSLAEVADEGRKTISRVHGFGKPQFEILEAALEERLMDFE